MPDISLSRAKAKTNVLEVRLGFRGVMITFIDLRFSPKGLYAGVVIDRLQRLPGVTSVMGEHDLCFHWATPEEFNHHLLSIHKALRGSEATYRLFTVEDSYQSRDPVTWFPAVDSEPSVHPAYPKKK
jgi:hypothetical protein